MTEEARRCIRALHDHVSMGYLLIGGFDGSVKASELINLIESLSEQLEQVTQERDAIEKDFAQAAKIMYMEDCSGACEVCAKNIYGEVCKVCEFKWLGAAWR